MQFTNLPTDLSESLISKVCRKNFTISELILTMINNDNFRVQLFNLEIEIVDDYVLHFNKDITLLDNIAFYDYTLIEKFEKLITDGWISIELLISYKTSLFEFLFKYAERRYFICGDKHGEKIFEYVLNPNIFCTDLCSDSLQCFDDHFFLKNTTVKISMLADMALDYLENMIQTKVSLKNYRFDIEIIYNLDFMDPECVDNMLNLFTIMDNLIKANEIKVDNFVIDLIIIPAVAGHITCDPLIELISNDYYVKKIKKISLSNCVFIRRSFTFNSIKHFKYLEKLDLKRVNVDYFSMGSLKSMKNLKQINFSESTVDCIWINKCLPDCIEKLEVFQTHNDPYTKFIFKIPASLKILKIHIEDGGNEFQFDRFDFTNAVNLEHIRLSLFRIVLVSDLYKVRINALKGTPINLKYLIYENFYGPFSNQAAISGITMDGIYSNLIRCREMILGLVRH